VEHVEWLRLMLAKAQAHAGELPDDVWDQDGLRLTGTVMRLDRVREAVREAWVALQHVYDDALERDRMLGGDGAVGGTQDGRARTVADILCAASAGF
jgi:hypothetical protein